jgi:integrase
MPRRRVWGQGGVRREPSGSWAVRWSENGRRRYKGGLESRALAERVLARVLGELAQERTGLAPDPRRFPTLGTLATEWLKRREHTHRSWTDDRGRWENHLEEHFGRLRANEVDVAAVRAFVEAKLRTGMNHDTLRNCVACLSTFCADLAERPRETGISRNPVAGLPKSLRRLFKSEHDPRLTPYLRNVAEVRALADALPPWARAAYACGVLAGLRTGEVLALDWDAVRLDEPRLEVTRQVQNGELGPLKDDEARILTGGWLGAFVTALKPWRLETGGRGLLFPPPKGERLSAKFTTPHRLYAALTTAATAIGRADILEWLKPWYGATRHTFASHWVGSGRPIAQLAAILGHSTTWVTERYAHAAADPDSADLFAFGEKTGSAEEQPAGRKKRLAEEHQ